MENKNQLAPNENIVRVGGDRMETICPTCKTQVKPRIEGKDPIIYARAIERQFDNGHKQVIVQSRGGANNKALTAVSIALRLIPNIRIQDVKLGMERIERENFKTFKKVTTLIIILSR